MEKKQKRQEILYIRITKENDLFLRKKSKELDMPIAEVMHHLINRYRRSEKKREARASYEQESK